MGKDDGTFVKTSRQYHKKSPELEENKVVGFSNQQIDLCMQGLKHLSANLHIKNSFKLLSTIKYLHISPGRMEMEALHFEDPTRWF